MTHDLWIIRHVFNRYAITSPLDITYTGLENDDFNTFLVSTCLRILFAKWKNSNLIVRWILIKLFRAQEPDGKKMLLHIIGKLDKFLIRPKFTKPFLSNV